MRLNKVQRAAYELIQADARFLYTLVDMSQNASNISSNYIMMCQPYIGIFADGHDRPHGTENYPAGPPGSLRQARYSAGSLFYPGGRGENRFSVRQRRRRAEFAV